LHLFDILSVFFSLHLGKLMIPLKYQIDIILNRKIGSYKSFGALFLLVKMITEK